MMPVLLLISLSIFLPIVTAQEQNVPQQQISQRQPSPLPFIVKDANLKVELVAENLSAPTSMIFLPDGSILVTEKTGEAKVISFSSANSSSADVSKVTIIAKFNVSSEGQRGLLGTALIEGNQKNSSDEIKSSLMTSTNITVNCPYKRLGNNNTTTNNNTMSTDIGNSTDNISCKGRDDYLFFYLTEDGPNNRPNGNVIYRYDWNDATKSISNKTLILQLPTGLGPYHNGGKMISSSYGQLFAVIGDLDRNGTLQNNKSASFYPDNTSVILKINPDGSPAALNPFLNLSEREPAAYNSSKYYAYGIRNSFGLAIDPVTGMLWDTENGPKGYDEINVVRPGFNSGWNKVYGPIERRNVTEDDLVNLGNSSTYADPVFSWRPTIGVTDIEFFNSTRLGNIYENNLFVGDFHTGSLYYFQLNEDRTGLILDRPGLSFDLVASGEEQREAVVFAKGFERGISDIATGADGYLYVLTLAGNIYRILPA
jgi:glucose/arabinose dehydrogenase